MKLPFSSIICATLLLFCVTAAQATTVKTYVVPAFTVNGPSGNKYLEQAVPQMLTSRLYWKGNFEVQASASALQAPANTSAAQKLLQQTRADYIVYGSVNIIGEDASLDIQVLDTAGNTHPYSQTTKVSQLTSALQRVANNISTEVFKRPPSTGFAQTDTNTGSGSVNQMNPVIVVNEDTPKGVYLNPQFRYSGAAAGSDSQLRSQAFPYAALGMEIVDADNDGKVEIFLIADSAVYAYRYEGERFVPIGELKLSLTLQTLSIRSIDLNRDGFPELIISAVDEKGDPQSMIYTYKNNAFTEVMRNIRYFLNVVKLPPDYSPTLIAQSSDRPRLFKPGVYEMIKNGDQLIKGKRLDLPEGCNVYNFTYMPTEGSASHVAMLTDSERLRMYTGKGARLSESEESYSGSAIGLEVEQHMPGLGRDDVLIPDTFYIPMRMLAVDLDKNGSYELLVNRPISTASKIFARYRFFPQSEVHSLFWDGIGMNLQWKTRRIKGSVTDIAIVDVNGDGILDLVTCVNTHPGSLGVNARKTVITAYPLDLSSANPSTRIDSGESEDNYEY